MFLLSLLLCSALLPVEQNMTSLNMYATATNRNFKLSVDNSSLFIRIGRESPEELGIDRRREVELYKVAEGLGLAPKLIAYQIDNGILVTEFIEGSSPSETRVHELDFLEQVVEKLKLLHSASLESASEKNVFRNNDLLLAECSSFVDLEKIKHWQEVRASFEKGYYEDTAFGICHGDLFRGNILENQEGRIYFIDWEYAYYGPIIDDLGKLCSANWLTDSEIEFVANMYWKSPNMRKLKQNIFMQQFNFYLWCKIQAQHNAENSFYGTIVHKVEKHLDLLEKIV
jgi:thiamine kinase-like enzyme